MRKHVCALAGKLALLAGLALRGVDDVAHAQAISAPWQAVDVGSPSLAGAANYSSGVFTVEGVGSQIWGTADQFYFVYQQFSGDFEIVGKVDQITANTPTAKVGLMMRSSLSASASHVLNYVTVAGAIGTIRRTAAGDRSTAGQETQKNAPVWLRLVRVGPTITSYFSADGLTWSTIGSDTLGFGASAYVGIAVESRSSSTAASARVSNVMVERFGLPEGQQSTDIGAPVLPGSATFRAGSYLVAGAGADIWSTNDQFHFVYQPISGNTDVMARVVSVQNTDPGAKAGIMIRESLTGSSRHAMALISASNDYGFQRRQETGGLSTSTSGGSGTAPGWVKLVRTGDLFEAYRSANGTTWTKMGSDTIPMGTTAYVGLAATSRSEWTTATHVIDEFSISAVPAPNQPPAVTVTTPANGTVVPVGATVTIAATATDPEGRMLSVDFYAGSTLLTRDTTAPYTVPWTPLQSGTHQLMAYAHDADGGTTASATVSLTVQQSTNQPPSVSLSVSGGLLSLLAPATITLNATATDPEGQLARVEFFSGTTRLATDSAAPYAFSWSGVPIGIYLLTAVAYDGAGNSAISIAVIVTVTGLLGSGPPTTVAFTASVDHSASVINYVLKVFPAGVNLATATPIAMTDLGKPAPASNGDITVDRSAFFYALPAGTYQATVTAVGTGGQTASSSTLFSR